MWVRVLVVILLSADNDPSLSWYYLDLLEKSWKLEKRHGNRRNSDGVWGDETCW